jgi:hypothetical protein
LLYVFIGTPFGPPILTAKVFPILLSPLCVNFGVHYTFGPKAIAERLQGFLLQIDIAEIIIHKADEPDAIVDFFDAHRLTRQASA